MYFDQKKIHILLASYALLLLLVPFASNKLACNILLTVITVLAAILCAVLIKKRTAPDIRYKEVMLVLSISAALVVMLLCLTGLHFGFYANKLSLKKIYTYVLPIAVSIVFAEIFRSVFLSQRQKKITCITFLLLVFLDILLFAEINPFRSVKSFMSLLGTVILPAISTNLLIHCISSKYGAWCVIPYRLIMALYTHLLPVRVAMPEAMLSFVKIAFPLLLLWFIQKLFGRRVMVVSRKKTALNTVSTVICVIMMFSYTAFTAGLFSYKSVVVASDSMKGEMSRGDMIVYEEYDGQTIQIGQIILFHKNETLVIHRVVDIKKINGVYRYFTKGDANDGNDTGYVTNDDLVGITALNIKYIGYPTVWLYEIFKK